LRKYGLIPQVVFVFPFHLRKYGLIPQVVSVFPFYLRKSELISQVLSDFPFYLRKSELISQVLSDFPFHLRKYELISQVVTIFPFHLRISICHNHTKSSESHSPNISHVNSSELHLRYFYLHMIEGFTCTKIQKYYIMIVY